MKKIISYTVVFAVLISCNDSKSHRQHEGEKKNKPIVEIEFERHLKILDSVVEKNPNDTIYTCCSESIDFMEKTTGIDGHADGTTLGKLFFSRNDFIKWRTWYEKNK
jgi:hypothetical protein